MMVTPPDASAHQQVHRALSSPVRQHLLDVLRDEPELDAASLAQRLGLHVNTVRTHLGVLEDAGLVQGSVEQRDRPGRPRLLYRAVAAPGLDPAPGGDAGYRFLAQVLASYLGAVSDDTAAAAEEAGRAWGRFVTDRPPPFQRLDADAAVAQLVAVLERFGFAPELERRGEATPSIVLRRCPFLDVAREHPEVVCSLHLGLMRGALDELGGHVQVEDLIPWARPEACVTQLAIPS